MENSIAGQGSGPREMECGECPRLRGRSGLPGEVFPNLAGHVGIAKQRWGGRIEFLWKEQTSQHSGVGENCSTFHKAGTQA